MTETIIDILRHGEPEGGRMYRGGATDHPLSASGWLQMQTSVGLHSAKWSAIVSSPMSRCADFAKQLADNNELPLQIMDSLREAGYGAWEGLTPEQILEDSEEAYWEFYADPVNARPQDAEPLEFFTPRINEALQTLLKKYQGQHILLVSHLGVTRAMLGVILGMPLASQQLIAMPYAGMLRIVNDRFGLRVVLF